MDKLLQTTADIVCAYLTNHFVPPGQVAELIADVSSTLVGLEETAGTRKQEPAVDPSLSVFPDRIICLEDGASYVSLKRVLARFGLTPDQYRQKWGTSGNYPMVAPAHAALLSNRAKERGLGRTSHSRLSKKNVPG